MKPLLLSFFFFAGWPMLLPEFPQANISNKLVQAELYLPDSATGYYQGTRFDWSGVIKSLEYKGHSFFGQWFKTYDPKKHDAVTGPVEEFEPVGFDDAAVGETFLKPGVGSLLKKDAKAYSAYTLYSISNPGTRVVNRRKDRVEFIQELHDKNGFAYWYKKTVRLTKGKPELVLEHSLKNLGTKAIETNVYDHNFFMIDGEPTGPAIKIKFPFEINGTGRGLGTFAEIRGKEINYTRPLQEREDMYIGAITGYQDSKSAYNFNIHNQRTGAGVMITSDQPLERLVFWASPTVSCPEPYIHIKAAPGEEFSWKIKYRFYAGE